MVCCYVNCLVRILLLRLFEEEFIHTFSNSLIIHIAISLPERPILVRWMSLETQWKTSWKPHAFRNDFKPVCILFLNLHIQKARRKHGHQQIYLFTQYESKLWQWKQHYCTFCLMHRGDWKPSLHSFPPWIDVFRTQSDIWFWVGIFPLMV